METALRGDPVMGDNQHRLMDLFNEARAKASAGEREAYLRAACGGDAALRQQVEALLAADSAADNFLQPPSEDAPADEGPGTVIGRYKLLQRIGEGGFGVVYMAEQLEPVRRKVALKIIKLGMDTREVIARFEAERQALALMDHANIAKVLDGGVTGGNADFPVGAEAGWKTGATSPAAGWKTGVTGRPYFVMELVKGLPITDYCDQQQLPPGARLELFLKVCHAVQHAHQKGVIHRDLKPSNILVTEQDGEAVPKIIDFGVAKAIGQPLTDKTLFTRLEQMIGTPSYMSPEQAGLGSLDVDTRTDIYALGVLLYELLTGTTPVLRETLHQAALDEIRRLIRETEPPKPSTRLQTLGGKLTEVAHHRRIEPAMLSKLVRGDLDWIVMKALEKDRRRRYDTANALAEDIERHLRHEPVLASPPGTVYRAQKFVRRHRVGVAMATAVSVALLAGLTLAVAGFVQARRERQRAETEAAIARAVNTFLQQDLLAQAYPENEADRDLKLRTVLDRAAAKIEGQFTHQPLVEAAIRLTLARTYDGLGEYSASEAHAKRAMQLRSKTLGPEHPDTLEAQRLLGAAYLNQDRVDEAELLWQELWETSRRVFGEKHTNTLAALSGLGRVYLSQGRCAEGEEVLLRLVEDHRSLLGPQHAKTLESMNQLALLYAASDQTDRAVEITLQTLDSMGTALGSQHPTRLMLMGNLAELYNRIGLLEDAINLATQVVSNKQQVLGAKHPETLLSKAYLSIYYAQGCHWQPCAALSKEIVDSDKAYWPGMVLGTANVHLLYDALASLLAGDIPSYRQFASELYDRTRETTDGNDARMV